MGQSLQYTCISSIIIIGYNRKTSNGVRCRDMGSEESTREEVGFGTMKVGDIAKKVQDTRLRVEVVWACIEKRRIM